MRQIKSLALIILGCSICYTLTGQDTVKAKSLSLTECIEYALEHNYNLKKTNYDIEKAKLSNSEMLGALMPQINGSASFNDNLKKAKFIMPNFINSMMPPNMQNPNADKYMTIEMGTNYNFAAGISLNQQLINFSLFNALKIGKTTANLSILGSEANIEEVIATIASLYYTIQATQYAVGQMEKSVKLMENMLKTLEISLENGLTKKIDVDRLKVNIVNLATQKNAINNAVETQKNLLKLQMGLDINEILDVTAIDIRNIDDLTTLCTIPDFVINKQVAYKIVNERLNMAKHIKKSAIYENIPTLSLIANYQVNGVSDNFFNSNSNYWYNTSIVGLNLRVPIFGGLSRSAKIKQTIVDEYKTKEEAVIIEQSLKMAYKNARIKLDETRLSLSMQHENQKLAEDVYNVAESNYSEGISPMTDMLNASQSLIQAQLNYSNALTDYMKAFVELKKTSGEIRDLLNNK